MAMGLSKIGLSVIALLTLVGCGGDSGPGGSAVRLIDLFDADAVSGAPAGGEVDPQALWSFVSAEDPLGWKAGQGVSGLAVRDGALRGKASTAAPVLHVESPASLDLRDGLYAVEVVLRATDGAKVHAAIAGSAPKFDEPADPAAWSMHADLEPGDEWRTITLRDPGDKTLAQAKHLLIAPTDAAGADFAIQSVRLISQREHRASTPSGVGWQGLAGVYHETIVSRAPESFTLEVDAGPDSFLDLSIGTVERGAVTFQIDAVGGGEERELLRRTLTTPHRWEYAPVELTGLSGKVSLRFSLADADDYTTGFWGSPVVRRRGAEPRTTRQPSQALGGAAAPRGVIIFLADTLRRDHLSFHGYDRATTPHLASLADEGTVFLDNISQASWTKVSVPSIMTSLYPASHRIRQIPDRISAMADTIAEAYRDAGYATASFPSNSFAGMMTNLHQGFEESHESASFDRDKYGPKTARRVVDSALEWIDRKKDVPFFAYVHVVDPHGPFEPREPYTYEWAARSDRERHDADWEKLNKSIKSGFRKNQKVALPSEIEAAGIDRERWLRYEMDWYDASILGMDAEIQRIREKLIELGIEDQVAFAFLSDHGEEFLEHNHMFHSQSAYGELANVPLFLHYAGVIPAGVKIDRTVRSIDLMPTLLDISGIDVPAAAQGQSLLPLIASSAGSGDAEELGWYPEIAVTEKHAEDNTDDPDDFTNALESFAMVSSSGEWKLVHNAAGREPLGREEFELYRHQNDPLDLENVAAEHPDVVEELRAELEIWKARVTQEQLPKGEEGTKDLPPDQLDQLRNLGYIQ